MVFDLFKRGWRPLHLVTASLLMLTIQLAQAQDATDKRKSLQQRKPKTRVVSERDQKRKKSTPIPQSRPISLAVGTPRVVQMVSGMRRSSHVSVVVRNNSLQEAHDVKVYLTGIGGVLLPLRGVGRIVSRGVGVYAATIRELYPDSPSLRISVICRECRIRARIL